MFSLYTFPLGKPLEMLLGSGCLTFPLFYLKPTRLKYFRVKHDQKEKVMAIFELPGMLHIFLLFFVQLFLVAGVSNARS